MLSLGDTDFNMISGGNVYIPASAAAESLTTQDGTVENSQYTRTYFFGGAQVGTSVMAAELEQDTALLDQSQQNINAAQDFSQSHTNLPYYLIAGGGALVLLFLLFMIIKIARS